MTLSSSDKKQLFGLGAIAGVIIIAFTVFAAALSPETEFPETESPKSQPQKTDRSVRVTEQAPVSIKPAVKKQSGYPDFTVIAENRSSAVVKVMTDHKSEKTSSQAESLKDFLGLPDGFSHRDQAPANAMGSGFLISADGLVVTNHHVIESADNVMVRLMDQREYEAEVIGTDPHSDLALLKIDVSDVNFIQLADASDVRVGEWVVAIGSPFGLDYSVSAGIVSAKGRNIASRQNQSYVPFIQTDVAINMGNSGGPLFNVRGDIVGINSQIFSLSGGSNGLSFAIPAPTAINVINQLKETGTVVRGWLGIAIQDVDRTLAESFKLDRAHGALITQLEKNGPADKAGLKVGDIVVSFNDQPVIDSADLPNLVGPVDIGSQATVVVYREGKKKILSVTVGKREQGKVSLDSSKSSTEFGRIGVSVESLSAKVLSKTGIKSGVMISAVSPKSSAAKAGLQVGDVVVQLGFDHVKSVKSFKRIESSLKAKKPVAVRIIRDGRSRFVSLMLES